MNQTQQIETLRGVNNSFAQSLVSQFDRKGSLSDKQWHWVEKLSNPQLEKTDSGYQRVVELLSKAREKLKYPKITFILSDPCREQQVRLHVAGERSKYSGQIQVTDGTGFGGKYYGRIDQDGVWHEGRDVSESVRNALNEFAGDPAGYAASHGRAHAHCCFCNTPIETTESLEAGYGPVCAKNYGLPWGGK